MFCETDLLCHSADLSILSSSAGSNDDEPSEYRSDDDASSSGAGFWGASENFGDWINNDEVLVGVAVSLDIMGMIFFLAFRKCLCHKHEQQPHGRIEQNTGPPLPVYVAHSSAVTTDLGGLPAPPAAQLLSPGTVRRIEASNSHVEMAHATPVGPSSEAIGQSEGGHNTDVPVATALRLSASQTSAASQIPVASAVLMVQNAQAMTPTNAHRANEAAVASRSSIV